MSRDMYVRSKVDEKNFIRAEDRCQLCEEAIKHEGEKFSSWIRVSNGECQWTPNFVDFDVVTLKLRNYLNNLLFGKEQLLKHPLTIFYVCGLDHYNGCRTIDSLLQEKDIACAVIYRNRYDEQSIHHMKKFPNAFYIPKTNTRDEIQDLSSTDIRNYYQNRSKYSKSAPLGVSPVVHQFMLNKYK